ncbi:MAG TPA: hypothetical protein VG929_08855 [Actinomycetota bacterium]|nr:hypothetical protein [Actinomycetota bacterium]
MKKLLVLLMVLGLIAGSIATAEAGKKKKKKAPAPRVMEVRYENPAIGINGVGGVCSGCPQIAVGAEERFISVEVKDDVSPVPAMRFSWDTDGDGRNDTGVVVCGSKTDAPLEVPPGVSMTAFPYLLPGPACPTGFAVSGSIKITFTATP